MKNYFRFVMICAICFSTLSFAEENESAKDEQSIKELNIQELDFESLSKETKVGELAKLVDHQHSFMDNLVQMIGRSSLLFPFRQEYAYVNGVLCHVAYYPYSAIYTVLSGPQYGLQTVLSPQGYILYINYDFYIEYSSAGILLHHYYSDSEVITGSSQVIVF